VVSSSMMVARVSLVMMVSSDKSSVIKDVLIGGRQGEGIEEVLGEVSGELEGSGVCAEESGGCARGSGVWSVDW
jgi:hypothetical protein